MYKECTKNGFTLIELVIIIVILGILAAFAVPRFVGLDVEARRAKLQSLNGSLRSAASLGHVKAIANNNLDISDNPDGIYNMTIRGVRVEFNGNWPRARKDGIVRLIQDLSGFEINATDDCRGTGPCIIFYPKSASNKEKCKVEYIFNGTDNEPPSYFSKASDCS